LLLALQVEVALKMAFRKFMTDHGLLTQQDGSPSDTRLEVRLPCCCVALTGHILVLCGCCWD
jgi:hypothetical protein